MKRIYSILVENRSGVLSKVAGLFSRRCFNIDSLVVGETEDPDVSCMTIVSSGNQRTIEQIEKQLLTGDADFSHMAEKAYKWVFNENSEEYNRVINILMKLNMSINDFKDKFIKETEKSSNQIPVILSGEPNNYASKGEFLQCNLQYRLTGSWKEVKIVFTNDLSSNTGKMKNARAKGIEIQLY